MKKRISIRKSDARERKDNILHIATIFSGIGVAEMAHRKVFGYSGTIFACEIDKFARRSYEANAGNHQGVPFYEDVRTLDATRYRGQVDVLVGGSPCQDFSIAGERAGTQGDRGNLIWQYYRIVKECRPEVFVFENVKGFLSIEKGKAYVNFLNALRDLGYHCHAEVLNTKDYGIPQNRERLYIVGFLDADRYFSFHFAPKKPLELTLGDMLEPCVDEKYFLSERAIRCFKKKDNNFQGSFSPKNPSDTANCLTTAAGNRRTDTFIIQRPRGFNKGGELELCPTISSNSFAQNNPLCGERIRKLTPRECLRLQGIGDDFKIVVSDTQIYKQAGNAMSQNVVEMILGQIAGSKMENFRLRA